MGGQEVDTQGDAFFVSFPRAGDALAALAMSHPQCDPIPREGAKKPLDELEDILPPQVFAAAKERGKERDLEATAKELLAELE